MFEIDARGLACPEPVVRTQRGVAAHPEGVAVTVDNEASVENIGRFARARKYEVEIRRNAEDTTLILTKA